MPSNLIYLDFKITKFLSVFVPHSSFFTYFFSFFSLKGNSLLIWILLIIIILVFEERKNPGISSRDKKFIMVFLLSFLMTFLFNYIFLKNFFHRPRPSFNQLFTTHSSLLTNSCPIDFSFPSGHAATAFAASCVLSYFDKKRRWFYYLVAVLISYSRIYLGCHYFLDVISGALIGYIISRLLLSFPDTFPFRRKS